MILKVTNETREDASSDHFFSAAISNSWSLARALVLLLLMLAALSIAIMILWTHATQNIATIDFKESDGSLVINRISFISKETQTSKTVLVPAAQLYVDTGLEIEPNSHYRIYATGLVSTSPSSPNYAQDALFSKSLSQSERALILKDYPGRDFERKFRTERIVGWRNPDGTHFYSVGDGDDMKPSSSDGCRNTMSERMKLLPLERYGALVGMITGTVPPDFRRLPETSVVANKMKQNRSEPLRLPGILDQRDVYLFCIGKEADIFQKAGNLIVQSPSCNRKVQTIDSQTLGSGKKLLLAVNDAVITEQDTLDWGIECDNETMAAWNKLFSKIGESSTLSKNVGRQGLWYLDNSGYFNVTLIEKKS